MKFGFDDYAENYFNQILDVYGSHLKDIDSKLSSKDIKTEDNDQASFEERISCLLLNSKNQLSVLYFNNGRKSESEEIQKSLQFYHIKTISKYLKTVQSDLIAIPKGDSGHVYGNFENYLFFL